MTKLKLTKKNYYSHEADIEYMSASQVKSFLNCEAKAKAELDGTYVRPESSALLIGSYIDSYFEGKKSFNEFKKSNPSIFNSRTGELKSEFKKCDEMIARIESDPVFMSYMEGHKQTIKTGKLFGVNFKSKFDVYNPKEHRIVDLKTVKDLSPMYKPGEGRLSPIEYWMWDLQMAIYAAIEGNDLDTFLAIVTKENPSDLALVEINKDERDACMEYLADKIPRFDAIKKGYVEPERCEHCDYCRATRKLTRPMTMDEMKFDLFIGDAE